MHSRGTALWVLAALVPAAFSARAAGQGSTSLASVASNGAAAHSSSSSSALSADGRYVAFASHAPDLVPDDTNGAEDVFLHDCLTGRTTRVSVSSAGAQGNGDSHGVTISGDGRLVAFHSEADDLVPGDTNGWRDVFVHDTATGATVRASVSASGGQGNERCGYPSLSADGRFLSFDCFADNLVPGDANRHTADVVVRDLVTGTLVIESRSTTGEQGNAWAQGSRLSGDGRWITFLARADNLVPGDTNDAVDGFVRDRHTGVTRRVSVSSAGVQADALTRQVEISSDGRFVAFECHADNLVPGDTNGSGDVFVHRIATGSTERVSLGPQGAEGNGSSYGPAISGDGSRVAFSSASTNLVPGDVNGYGDVFLRDRTTGQTALVSRSTSGAWADDFSAYAAISDDGRFVSFDSVSGNLVRRATPAARDVYVRDTAGCSPTIATFCSAGTTGHGCVPAISGSGTPSAAAGAGFTIAVDAVEGQLAGLLFYGVSGPLDAPFAGGSSVLCAARPLQRTVVQSTGGTVGACDGRLALDWNRFVGLRAQGVGLTLLGGETAWAQAWFRDPLAPGGGLLSDALWFDVCQ